MTNDIKCLVNTINRVLYTLTYIKSDFIRKNNEILEITYFLGN